MVMSHSAALTLKYILKIVLPARQRLQPALLTCRLLSSLKLLLLPYTHKTVALKRLSGEIIQDKSNLVTILNLMVVQESLRKRLVG